MALVDSARLARIKARQRGDQPWSVPQLRQDIAELVEMLDETESERARADGCEDRERFLIAQIQSIEAERIQPLVEQCERQKAQIEALLAENERFKALMQLWRAESDRGT